MEPGKKRLKKGKKTQHSFEYTNERDITSKTLYIRYAPIYYAR